MVLFSGKRDMQQSAVTAGGLRSIYWKMDFPPHHAQSNAVGQNKMITKTTHSDRTKTCHKKNTFWCCFGFEGGIPVGYWKAPNTAISHSISLKQLKEILQLCPCDSSGTVWAEVALLFNSEDFSWSHPACRTCDVPACRVYLSPMKVSVFLGKPSCRQGYQAWGKRVVLWACKVESLLTTLSPRDLLYHYLALPVPPGSSLGLRHHAKGFV